MKISSRIIILLSFILFSVILFLGLRALMTTIFISNNADPFTEMGQAINLLPYLFGTFSLLLVFLSWMGMRISKRKNRLEIYGGFGYSAIYSLLVFLAFVFYLIFYLYQF